MTKKILLLLFMSPLLALAASGCASQVPDAVKLAQEKQARSLAGARRNIVAFVEAGMTDLEAALVAQIDIKFDARLAALADENNKAPLDEIRTEIAAAQAARRAEKESVAQQMAKFKVALKDLDNAIRLNEIIGEYLERDFISAQDIAELFKSIDSAIGE